MNERGRGGGGSFAERRKKVDWVVNAATVMSILSWAFALGVWLILDAAAPQQGTAFTDFFGATARTWWDVTLLPWAFAALVISVLSCLLAFFFNMARMKRKTDKYRKSIIIIGCVSIIGLILFLLNFGAFIF